MENHIEFFIRMCKLADQEQNDISWGERELRMGARMGCDCGCGGDSLDDESFEHERDESQYQELFDLPESLRNLVSGCAYFDFDDEQEIEELTEIANENKEEILKYLLSEQ